MRQEIEVIFWFVSYEILKICSLVSVKDIIYSFLKLGFLLFLAILSSVKYFQNPMMKFLCIMVFCCFAWFCFQYSKGNILLVLNLWMFAWLFAFEFSQKFLYHQWKFHSLTILLILSVSTIDIFEFLLYKYGFLLNGSFVYNAVPLLCESTFLCTALYCLFVFWFHLSFPWLSWSLKISMLFITALFVFYVYNYLFVLICSKTVLQWLLSMIYHPSVYLLSIQWIVGIIVSVIIAWYCSYRRLPVIINRKIFHFAAFWMFFPAAFEETSRQFLTVSLSVVICIFFVLEYWRSLFSTRSFQVASMNWGIQLINSLSSFYQSFLDQREQTDGIITSHISLLFGCWIPCFASFQFQSLLLLSSTHESYGYNNISSSSSSGSLLASSMQEQLLEGSLVLLFLLGILAVGIGDAMAAVVGTLVRTKTWNSTKLFHSLRISSVSSKSIGGSLALFLSIVVGCWSITMYFTSAVSMTSVIQYPWSYWLENGFIYVVLATSTTIIECLTRSNDNIVLPLSCVVIYLGCKNVLLQS